MLVVTVDPARRLATRLGFAREAASSESGRAPLQAAGAAPRGELWAEMLDTKQSWDALVTRHAPDAATAKRILDNPLYQDISGRFVQSHDYIAVERLYELHSEGNYDLIVVDTPPTRNAWISCWRQSALADFFSSRLLRLLTVPYKSRLADVASRPFYYVADRVIGSQFLEDIAEFFILFQTLSDGFVQRAQEVERLLADRRTTFIVVSTLEAMPVREAEAFMDLLPVKGFHLGAHGAQQGATCVPAGSRRRRAGGPADSPEQTSWPVRSAPVHSRGSDPVWSNACSKRWGPISIT